MFPCTKPAARRRHLSFLLAALALSYPAPAEPNPPEVAALLRRVLAQDASPSVRTAAARLLAPLRDTDARDHLLQVLELQPDDLTRYSDALRGLAATGHFMHRLRVIEEIDLGSDQERRVRAARVAFGFGISHSMGTLLMVFSDPDRNQEERVAAEAAGPLTQLANPPAMDLLVLAYERYGAHPEAGRVLAQAMRGVHASSALEAVLQAAASSSWETRAAAALHLRSFPMEPVLDTLDGLLADPTEAVRVAAGKTLLRRAPRRLAERARRLLRDSSTSAGLRVFLFDALARLRWSEAEPEMLAGFRQGTGRVRRAAMGALGAIGSLEALPELIEILDDRRADDPGGMRTACARALAGSHHPMAQDALDRALRLDEVDLVVQGAAESLARLDDPRAWRLLQAALGSQNRLDTRLSSVAALADHEASLGLVARALRADPAPIVRVVAAAAVGAREGEERFQYLTSALSDTHAETRAMALQMLAARASWSRRSTRRAVRLIQKDEASEVRLQALRILEHASGNMATRALARVAHGDAAREVRALAHRTLELLSSERALVAALQAIEADPDAGIRRAAAEAIGRLNPESGFEALRSSIFREPDVSCRRAAVLALARLVASPSL
jgi:HEAT repeat protein